MINLKVGDTFESELIVEYKHSAAAFGSGKIEVFSTPMMIGLMENASLNCAQKGLAPHLGTVGTFVDVKHTAATPIGMKVVAKAELIEVDGKKLVFKVEAFDEVGLIGSGTHGRFVIDSEKFLAKINEKGKA
jgi:predicted thioesterase